MNKTIRKSLALGLAAVAMGFGASAARANLINDKVTGCVAYGVPAGGTCTDGSGNQFLPLTEATVATVGNAVEFSRTFTAGTVGGAGYLNWMLSVDFGIDANGNDIVNITFNNNLGGKKAAELADNSLLTLGDFDFGGGLTLAGFADVKLTVDGADLLVGKEVLEGKGTIKPLLNAADINAAGDGYTLAFNNDGPTLAAGKIAVLTGRLVTTPEPGSLALIGVVLLALAGAHARRGRLFGFRFRPTSQTLAN